MRTRVLREEVSKNTLTRQNQCDIYHGEEFGYEESQKQFNIPSSTSFLDHQKASDHKITKDHQNLKPMFPHIIENSIIEEPVDSLNDSLKHFASTPMLLNRETEKGMLRQLFGLTEDVFSDHE